MLRIMKTQQTKKKQKERERERDEHTKQSKFKNRPSCQLANKSCKWNPFCGWWRPNEAESQASPLNAF